MQAWYLCENPYPFVPPEVLAAAPSVRASLPNRYCDPAAAARLFEECLDEYLLCDEVGLNIISNEHHSGINCLYGASPLILGILARQTRNVRILSLGTLVTVRQDPVRIAEEYATADVISRGRLDIGFVKSGGSEMASGNANPVGIRERFWEAIDLIRKTLAAREGPFSWEGKYFTHRHVNIWPRPWQEPHPPLWAATGDSPTARELGRRGLVNAIFLRGVEGTRRAWSAYREARAEAGLPPPLTDRFAYMGFTYVGDSNEEGVRVGGKSLWFLTTGARSGPQFSRYLPGQASPQMGPQIYAPGRVPARPGCRMSPGRRRPCAT
jgi:alkanesulfonate monooxygenase SsuD/methylene tetrahydromethanopterin reductase-like flavin-dependent oxidoreductase (luciferase family)